MKPDCSCCSACVQKMLHCICNNISFINSQTALDNSFSILSEPADKDIYLPLWIETFRLGLDQLLDNLSYVVAKNRKMKRDCWKFKESVDLKYLHKYQYQLLNYLFSIAKWRITFFNQRSSLIHNFYIDKKYIQFSNI